MKSIKWKKLGLELLVVFLGVTGGFILNNLRDTKKDIKLEKKYIESFIQNIDTNIAELENIIGDDSIWFSNMKDKYRQMAVDSLPKDSSSVIVNNILMTSNLTLATSTFEDIKFSGNLNLIRNYDLKEEIVKYHNEIEGAKFVDGYYNDYFSEFVLPYIMDQYDLAKNQYFETNNQSNAKLFNILAGYYSFQMQRMEYNKALLSSSNKVKEKLVDYLK